MQGRTTTGRAMSAGTLTGDRVVNRQGEHLGKLEEIMLDLNSGCVAYVVLSFGGVMGIGDKFFAIPWAALTVDLENKQIVMDITQERLKNAPGFDKDNWPKTPDREWLGEVYGYYGYNPYWED